MSTTSTAVKVVATAAGVAAAAIAGVVATAIRTDRRTVVHVDPHEAGWALRTDGAQKAARTFSAKREAVSAGREMAHERAPSELVIHRADGSVQDRHRYDD